MRAAGRAGWPVLVSFAGLILAGCGSETDTPEQQIRAWLVAGEAAVQARQLDEARALVAEDYRDQDGRDRRELVRLLAGHMLRNQSIHLFTRIDELRIVEAEPARAEVVLYVAMAGSPITGIEQLAALRADLYRFELSLGRADDQWRLQSSRWRRISPEEFIR